MCECRLEKEQTVNHTPKAAVVPWSQTPQPLENMFLLLLSYLVWGLGFDFETGSHRGQADLELKTVAEDDLELQVLLQPPKCWDIRCVISQLAVVFS